MKPHMAIPLKLLIVPFKAANTIGWLLMTPKKKYFLLLLQKSICYSFSELTLVQFIITIKPLLLNVFKAALAGVLINWQMASPEGQTEEHNHLRALLWQFQWIIKSFTQIWSHTGIHLDFCF